MMSNTVTALIEIISGQLDVKIKREEIHEDVALMEEGLGLDSIAIVELVTLVEERFSIRFHEDDLSLETFKTVRTLAGLVDSRCTEQGASIRV